MDMNKINIVENIVGNLTLDIKKLFDKGEIDKLYSRIYEEADRIAVFEAKRYHDIQLRELKREMSMIPRSRAGIEKYHRPDVLKYFKRDEKYRNARLSFHLKQMYTLLELYVQSKTKSTS